ncbi:MAG: manganese efflux pump MntP family protein [Clostridia bacterium]
MDIISLLLIAIALSMDAMAVAVTSGILVNNPRKRDVIKLAAFFGVFQFIMPVIGWMLVKTVSGYVESVDHWIAFALLSFIGIRMIIGALNSKNDIEKASANPFLTKTLLLMAIATSIDALAVGASLGFADINIWFCGILIGVVTFFLSALGVYIGKKMGKLFKKHAELIGGVILIGIGLKILIEHLTA